MRTKVLSYIDAFVPIIYFVEQDYLLVDLFVKSLDEQFKISEWHFGFKAEINFKHKNILVESNLIDFLEFKYKNLNQSDSISHELIVIKDFHLILEHSPEILSVIKTFAQKIKTTSNFNFTLMLVTPIYIMPQVLENDLALIRFDLPNTQEIKVLIDDFKTIQNIKIPHQIEKTFISNLRGLHFSQIIQILSLSFQNNGQINQNDHQVILDEKEQILKKSNLLELIPLDTKFEDIGGLELLKNWLSQKEKIYKNLSKALEFGVSYPKGILMVGLPGCGKSLTAKATAAFFQMPLLKLDIGKILGKYVGESENNLARSLEIAKSISPCVLWIDEIEKAFAGIGEEGAGNSVTTRLLGNFLTWLQEKKDPIFVIATANDIQKMPPELLRKGRFDEMFFVELPNESERLAIIQIHLKKYKKLTSELSLSIQNTDFLKATNGYSGSDLECIVKEAIERAFVNGQEQLTIDLLKSVQKDFKSISAVLGQKLLHLKEQLKAFDLKPSSKIK
jgi:SpoVK/Ycf46/Vps4 family AAA+-type ATPase